MAGLAGFKEPNGQGCITLHLWHKYSMPSDQKIIEMLGVLCSPLGSPAMPFGIPGEVVQGPGGQPLFRTKAQSVYGPPGGIVPPVGMADGVLMEPGGCCGIEFAKKWRWKL